MLIAGALVVTTGCLDQDFGDLIGSTEREGADLLSFHEAFSYSGTFDPTSPPMSPEDAYQTGRTTFNVPEDTRGLTVEYDVTFSSTGGQSAPEQLQEVRLTLDGPSSEENETVTATSSANGTWTFQRPTAGTWTFSYQARGEGVVTATGVAQVPVDG